MQTVLVTGANGFVGKHLVKELVGNGLRVIGVGGRQADNGKPEGLADYLMLNLTEPEAVKKIDFSAIDGVIHLAALSAAAPSFDEPMNYITTNIGIETNLFETALAQNARPRFLVVSSGMLYDPEAALPLTEESAMASISPYAVSKIGQEQMAHYYGSRGFEYVIARPFNHIGPGQNTGFIVPDLTKQAVACQQGKLNEILVGNLDAERDYTDVRDIVRAYRLMLEKAPSGEIYNVCSGNTISGHDILDGILKVAGINPQIKENPALMRPSDHPLIYGNHDKLTTATGWQPEVPIEKTLADVLADWQSRKS